MKGIELLEQQLKEARRVIWPNTGQESAIKFIYQVADHLKDIYAEIEELKNPRYVVKEQEYVEEYGTTGFKVMAEEGVKEFEPGTYTKEEWYGKEESKDSQHEAVGKKAVKKPRTRKSKKVKAED